MIVVAITDFSRASVEDHLASYAGLGSRFADSLIAIQVRIPGAAADRVRRAAIALQPLGLPLIVNDRLDVAVSLGLGVHLGRRSVSVSAARRLLGSEATVSVACHSADDVARARDDGATWALLSPIFSAYGKGPPLGLDALEIAVARGAPLPVIALGGVSLARSAACLAHGAAGFAGIRAFLMPEGP